MTKARDEEKPSAFAKAKADRWATRPSSWGEYGGPAVAKASAGHGSSQGNNEAGRITSSVYPCCLKWHRKGHDPLIFVMSELKLQIITNNLTLWQK